MKLIDVDLRESLFSGDLNGLILPLVSINEYSAKIDEKAVVVAFFSDNPDAADDLSVFIEKSAIEEILDSEVSSAPDEDGQYLIFIEIENKKPVDIIIEIIKIVNHVCKVDNWQFQAYKLPRTYALTRENLSAYFNKISELGLT